MHPTVCFRRANADSAELHQVRNSWPGENLMSRMSWPMMAALRCYGCDSPYANFGTVKSKSSREGRGRGSCRRSASPPSTGNNDYYRARSGCT